MGNLFWKKEADELIFGDNGNIKFIVTEGSEILEYDLTDSLITSFKIGDRLFEKITFSPCAKGKGEAKVSILESMYTSDKINLYKYYPIDGALGGAKTELAFKKATEDNPISLMDTRFLILKKGLAQYFEDCADLSQMCTEGSFAMNSDDLIKAARIYSEVCE